MRYKNQFIVFIPFGANPSRLSTCVCVFRAAVNGPSPSQSPDTGAGAGTGPTVRVVLLFVVNQVLDSIINI